MREFGLALTLARRELRGGLKGFGVFLGCLTLGVAAIASVGSLSQSVLGGLAAQGQSLLGGDLDLRMVHRTAGPEELAWLKQRADVSVSTHMRAMVRAPGEERRSVLVELRAVDDVFPLYGEVVLDPPLPLDQALGQSDGLWGAAIDRTLVSRLDLGDDALGTEIFVGEGRYQIRAILEREPDRIGTQMMFGASFMVSTDSLPQTGLLRPGALNHTHYRLRVSPGESPAALRAEILETFPEAGWQVRGTAEAAPGAKRFIERLGMFLSLVGLTSLLVGGVGVGNAVRSYLEGKTATIATLKCLGASGRLVFRVYLAQVLALASLGIAIGLALGAATPFAVNALVGDSFGWQGVSAVFPAPLALAAAFGVLITLVFSLWPLQHAQAVPAASLFRDLIAPDQTSVGAKAWAGIALLGLLLAGLAVVTAVDKRLALYFVAGALGALATFRLAAYGVMTLARRAGRPRHAGLRLALANLYRPGARTGGVIMSLGLGLTLLVTNALIEGNLAKQVGDSLPEEAPNFYFLDIQPSQAENFEQAVGEVAGVREIRRVPMLRGRIAQVNGKSSRELDIPPEIEWVFRGDRGLTWTREPPEDTELTAGEWWPADYSGKPLVSLDDNVGRLLGIGPGDTMTINLLGRNIEVTIANLRVIDWSRMTINFVMVFSPGILEAAPQTQIATVKVSAEQEDQVERAVTGNFANISAIRVRDALTAVGELIGNVGIAVRAVAGVALFAGILVLAGAVAAGHHRRIYDAVILKVLGATRGRIVQAFLIEYGLMGLVSAAIASVIGTLAAYLIMTEVLRGPFTFIPQAVASTAVVALIITLCLGFIGTWRALGHKAAPLLRND